MLLLFAQYHTQYCKKIKSSDNLILSGQLLTVTLLRGNTIFLIKTQFVKLSSQYNPLDHRL